MLSCDFIEAETTSAAEATLAEGVDLVVVDMDSTGVGGMEVIRRALSAVPPPAGQIVIALAGGRVTVSGAVDAATLRLVLASLRR